ncbi:MAG: hypothetical protein GEV13_33205 [Rhodospirillales bacterium]|nr:hypothetical protein [Rhodospirillales bacterium]
MTAEGPHPLLIVRHRATLRAAALTSRLKLLPSADAREAQRWARFAGRNGAAPKAVRHNGAVRKPNGEIDWVETARKSGLQ